ncbi:hypothetical protein JOE11_004335 [Robbsia andropogonis]
MESPFFAVNPAAIATLSCHEPVPAVIRSR